MFGPKAGDRAVHARPLRLRLEIQEISPAVQEENLERASAEEVPPGLHAAEGVERPPPDDPARPGIFLRVRVVVGGNEGIMVLHRVLI